MKVLVIGAAGQVGGALLDRVPPTITSIGLSRAELDLRDERAVVRCMHEYRPNLIINGAAYTAVDRAETEEELAWSVNARGAQHVAVAAREVGARMIHLSTDFVFDGTASLPYPPHAETRPLSVYGRSKRAGEEAVLQTLSDRSVVLRTAWVYAAHGHNFVQTMLKRMATDRSVRVVADQVGTPTAAASIAQAVWAIAVRPDITGIQHWTDAGVASWYDFAVAIAEDAAVLGLLPTDVAVQPISTSDYPTPARRPSFSALEKGDLPGRLGITPVHWRIRLRGVLEEIRDA